MTDSPRVSIITPIYNAAPFLRETIESVLTQSFAGWELLLIDDGSTDESPAIAQAYAQNWPGQIRYFTHEGHVNRGKSSSRNVGILHAQGEFLVFLDADDVLLPQKLAQQLAHMDAHPEAGMVYGRTLYWHRWASGVATKGKDYASKLGVAPRRIMHPPELLAMYLRDSGTVPCLCSPLVRRALVLQVGLFDERIQHLYEDQVLLAKLTLTAPVFVSDEVGERYRQHAGSSSNVAQREGQYHPWLPDVARLRYLEWLEGYLADARITDNSLQKAMRRALMPYRSPRLAWLLLPVRYALAMVLAGLSPVIERVRDKMREVQGKNFGDGGKVDVKVR